MKMYLILCVSIIACVISIFVNTAYSQEYNDQLPSSSFKFQPKDNAVFQCLSDVALPNITWSVENAIFSNSTHDTNITRIGIDKNVTTSYFHVVLDWYNDNNEVWCTTSDSVNSTRKMIAKLHLKDSAVLVNYTTCTEDNFQEQNGCSLTSTVYFAQYARIQWTYHYSDSEKKVILHTTHCKPGIKIASLFLKNYRAGFYSLEVLNDKSSTIEATHTFQINTNSSILQGINDSCNLDTDCIALHSMCMDGVCMCQTQYPIPSSNSQNATTCLEKKDFDEQCFINEQCQHINSLYDCIHGKCHCKSALDYTYMYVKKLQAFTCIQAAFHGNFCTYDEECRRLDKHMKCFSGLCYCDEQYVFVQRKGCIPSTEYYNNTIRVCIVSLIVFILAIAIVLIFAHTQRRLLGRSNLTRQQQIHIRYLFGSDTFRQTQAHGTVCEVQFPPSYDEVQSAEDPPPSYAEYTVSLANSETLKKVTHNFSKENFKSSTDSTVTSDVMSTHL